MSVGKCGLLRVALNVGELENAEVRAFGVCLAQYLVTDVNIVKMG
jgi:hypothetical protein